MIDIKLLFAKGCKILFNPPALRNCILEKTSHVCSGSELNSVDVGRYTYVGNRCFMVNVEIGSFCSIADKCSIGGAIHPMDRVSTSPVFHSGKNVLKKNFAQFPGIITPKTVIENDVWIGQGVYIKAGVTIHTGAVVGMGSVVTKNIGPYEIWAGNPAKMIRKRFDEETIRELLKTRWWEWSENKLENEADTFCDVSQFLDCCMNGENG